MIHIVTSMHEMQKARHIVWVEKAYWSKAQALRHLSKGR